MVYPSHYAIISSQYFVIKVITTINRIKAHKQMQLKIQQLRLQLCE